MHSTPFTIEETDLLIKDGWSVTSSFAYKNYHRIKKVQDEEFEVDTLVTDEPDGNDYWEWDSGYRTLEKAMRREHCS